MLEFIEEVDSPSLKACLDAPLLVRHDEAYYREAISATGALMVHTHFGGRFTCDDSRRVVPLGGQTDYVAFMRLAKEIAGFAGHTGYELCSPVLIGHDHAGQAYALRQAEMACEYMRAIIDGLGRGDTCDPTGVS
jgi:sugar phosphate isomerase/epimerase